MSYSIHTTLPAASFTPFPLGVLCVYCVLLLCKSPPHPSPGLLPLHKLSPRTSGQLLHHWGAAAAGRTPKRRCRIPVPPHRCHTHVKRFCLLCCVCLVAECEKCGVALRSPLILHRIRLHHRRGAATLPEQSTRRCPTATTPLTAPPSPGLPPPSQGPCQGGCDMCDRRSSGEVTRRDIAVEVRHRQRGRSL